MRFVQNIGRGLRQAKGKVDLLILDHSDTSLRLGFVTDIHHDTLNAGKEQTAKAVERKVPLPKECKACGYLNKPGAVECANCGSKHMPTSRAVEGNGELAEFAGGKHKRPKPGEFTLEQKRQFLGELKAYCQMKNYKPGWASNKYREKFAVWPAHEIANVEPRKLSDATLNWIKSRNIAWARSKKNDGYAEHGVARDFAI